MGIYCEMLKGNADLKTKLFKIIDMSKTEEKIEYGASNAIQILNQAGVPFSYMDLSGIRIPDANLQKAMLSYTILKKSDLTNVNLASAYLGNCNLSGSDMTDVQFKELPALFC